MAAQGSSSMLKEEVCGLGWQPPEARGRCGCNVATTLTYPDGARFSSGHHHTSAHVRAPRLRLDVCL
eukprot:scaffold2789_cov108-Isochrysis_galbana.AAC.3